MKEWTKFLLLTGAFLVFYAAPIDEPVITQSLGAGISLLQEYARKHVLSCLVPAFFIAGTIAVYIKEDAVIRLLGPEAKKYIAYPVAGLSGGILAVCSCTILPPFTGIYKRGAGIGPAVTFLFTGSAINITAILLTGGVLGCEFAASRLAAALVISVIAGLVMAFVFRDHDRNNAGAAFATGLQSDPPYSNWLVSTFFVLQLAVLIVLGSSLNTLLKTVFIVVGIGAILFVALFKFWREHDREWMQETWNLTKKILQYLFVGVFLAGILEVVLPQTFVTTLVGENTLHSNLAASLFGALMYFATLTEVPIIQKLLALGMAKGPALTLLLTGNALSLPSVIVLVKIMGPRQATVYVISVVLLSAVAGLLLGTFI